VRILFCVWDYASDDAGGAGGTAHQAQLQAEELTRRGHQVTVVSIGGAGATSGSVRGVPVRRIGALHYPRLQKASRAVAFLLWALPRWSRFDLIHLHMAEGFAASMAVLGRLTGTPVYMRVGAGKGLGPDRYTRPFAMRWVSRVQAPSRLITAEALSYGVRRSRIAQIPHAIDCTVFQPAAPAGRAAARRRLGLPDGEVILLYVGRLARYKGISELMEAWQTLSRTAATLVLVGAGETEDPLPEPPSGPRIEVRAWTEDVGDYYRAADAFVLPSHFEGMSNALLEAMACGLAVVATRVGAAEEMISDGESGLLVDVGRVDQLREALSRLIFDPELRAGLGVEAARTVRDRYAVERVVDQIEAAYRELRVST